MHLVILLALLIGIPFTVPPAPPEDQPFTVEFSGTADVAPIKGEKPSKIAAPADADTPATMNPALVAPTKAPLEVAAPPPPPPPPPPPQPDLIRPPMPTPTPPPDITPAPAQMKPPPPKPLMKPQPTPPPKLQSTKAQPHETKQAVPDTSALDNTLEKMLADQPQVKPPTHRYNPERGGIKGGGALTNHGNLTGALSAEQRKQIGASVRPCYSEDTEARNYATYSAIILVTIDAQGTARDVALSPQDQGRANADPAFRAFAERAQRAVLDPQCAKLPVPPEMLGKPSQQLTFRFRP